VIIVPKADQLTEPYWDGARRGVLLVQRCRRCDTRWHPPMPLCPACQSTDHEWKAVSGRGRVFSYTVVHHAAHVAMAGKTPYLVALIDLEEGVRLVSNILNCPMAKVAIGMPVQVTFQDLAPGIVLPQFEPAAP
jgi:uncharacterized OB-fold protein